MKIKTSELAGAALDWAVAKCEGIGVVAWKTPDRDAYYVVMSDVFTDKKPTTFYGDPDDTYYPSVDWAQGGPIIEREKISTQSEYDGRWHAHSKATGKNRYGPTPLVAAMRTYVASKLGDEINILEELL
jgi:hypothetical protein